MNGRRGAEMIIPLATETELGRPRVRGYILRSVSNDLSTMTSVSRYIPPLSERYVT